VHNNDFETRAINVVRGLAMDAPRKANSGHTGTALALAPLAHVLFTRILRFDAATPTWPNRDRFILSAGHASILLYSYLYLLGYGLELSDIEDFRQLHAKTPGHPEYGHTKGVEVTTGPLGQGFANAVGMAIAEAHLRAQHGASLVEHNTVVIAGDGCLEEGISHEAASLAGHLGLGKLLCIFDNNHISIDGPTDLAVSDDTAKRFESYGWHVEDIGGVANDLDALESAIIRAQGATDRPSLLILRSHIGWPAPHLTDTAAAHGEVFSPEEIAATKELLGLTPEKSFDVPDDVLAFYREAGRRGSAERQRRPGLQVEKIAAIAPSDLPTFEVGQKIATRNAFNVALNQLAPKLPSLVSGSADLTGNTGVLLKGEAPIARDTLGARQLHFGIREHAMGAVMNGMALHGSVLPVGGTFFVFSDYMRPAVRLAALSGAHLFYSFTHDSIGLGEDGPTHQPIEHLASLRAMPGLCVVRPADANETAAAFLGALDHDGPVAFVLSRQNLTVLAQTHNRHEEVCRGGYILAKEDETKGVDLIIVATGSEVSPALGAAESLRSDGVNVRVVSLISWEWFEKQDPNYRETVLPKDAFTLSVEAGATFGWERYADASIGIDSFGQSAPAGQLFKEFGLTSTAIAQRAKDLLRHQSTSSRRRK
jgi:transketolase